MITIVGEKKTVLQVIEHFWLAYKICCSGLYSKCEKFANEMPIHHCRLQNMVYCALLLTIFDSYVARGGLKVGDSIIYDDIFKPMVCSKGPEQSLFLVPNLS